MATPTASKVAPTNYDLTDKLIAHIDRHMVVPVLEFLQENKLYNAREIAQAKYDVLSQTKMVDARLVAYNALGKKDKPTWVAGDKAAVASSISEASRACEPLLSLLSNAELVSSTEFTLSALASRGVNDSHITSLYQLARINFDAGNYITTWNQLQAVIKLTHTSDDSELRFSAMWGKLSASIVLARWDQAFDDLKLLRDVIDRRSGSDLTALQQRTWLIHWSLFIFPKLDNGKVQLIEWLMEPKLLNAIQVSCPHILRYLTAAAIITKRQQKRSISQKNVLKDTVRLLVQEKGVYSDPLTEFLTALYVEFDFDLAHTQLKLCKRVLVSDFVLHSFADEFLESARALIFETYCRIHKCIDVKSLSAKLEFKEGEAERKILELIRVARVDARIDTDKNMVIVEKPYPTVYQQVIDKTKSSLHRSQLLITAIDKRSTNHPSSSSSARFGDST